MVAKGSGVGREMEQKVGVSREKLLYCCCSVTKSCPTLCDHMDCGSLGSSVHEISQAKILEWVDTFFFRESSWTRDQTYISCIGRQILYH